MRSLLIYIVCVIFCIPSHIHASDNYIKKAEEWLYESFGTRYDNLSIIKEGRSSVLVGDKHRCFVLLAKDSFSAMLENPVLAYGNNSCSDNSSSIMSYYDNILQRLRTDSVCHQPKREGEVAPLLKQFSLWQAKADLSNIGLRGTFWGGCVPTSVLMILYYHKWPKVMHGYYNTYVNTDTYGLPVNDSNETIRVNVEGTVMTWPDDLSIYNERKRPRVPPILWTINGLLCNAMFGQDGTGASINSCVRTLIYHYGYSRKMVCDHTSNIDEFIEHAHSEIDAGRPFITSHFRHAFVCDGYKNDYLHFNMGWGGHMNGFYRILTTPNKDEWEFLSGIAPDTIEACPERQISLKVPGTLQDSITPSDYSHIKKLTLSGVLNKDDIKMICRLAGQNRFNIPFGQRGNLKELDLSDATILPASGNRTNMSAISEHMFMDCKFSNIILPKNTIRISSYAFARCELLEQFVIPQNVRYVSATCVQGCEMLSEIKVPEKLKLDNTQLYTSRFCTITTY